ncbi:hypothetical protein MSPP1_000808 [Malassezia sp. CBS 17886]|nr:hypothetical protein MSPP1_000808 [Malassezia sp. CBS 17886]
MFPSRRIQALRAAWCVLVLWGERGVFYCAVGRCDVRGGGQAGAFRVLILSDPQIIGAHTYERFSAVMTALATLFSDQYLRKVWLALQRRGLGASMFRHPRAADLAVVLGDVTDRGRWFTDYNAWTALHARWTALFPGATILRTAPHIPLTKRQRGALLPTLVVPGNHDIGLGTETGGPSAANAAAATWFRDAFAPRVSDDYMLSANGSARSSWNARVPVAASRSSAAATHELLLVNAMDLVGMHLLGVPFLDDAAFAQAKARARETSAFVDMLADGTAAEAPPRILFTHVPLARGADEHSCDVPWHSALHGVRRESQRARVPGGDILQGGDSAGTYQNLISNDISEYVLRSVQPVAVFSGDDHDHCETVHHGWRRQLHATGSMPGFSPSDVPELTVKSLSMLEGVQRPGFAWLELHAPESHSAPAVDYTPCLLPDQVRIWLLLYVPCFLATALFLAVSRIRRASAAILPRYFDSAGGAFELAIVPLLLWLALQA